MFKAGNVAALRTGVDLRMREGLDGMNVENNDERKLPQIELNSLYAANGYIKGI